MHVLEVVAHLFHPRRSNNHRPWVLHPHSFFSFTLLLVGFASFVFTVGKVSPEMNSILGYSSEISTSQVIALTNAERAKSGLPQLTENHQLSVAARAKAADMFENQYWAHVSPSGKQPWDFITGSGYKYSAAGENLARDFMQTSEMIASWMGSPTHKANLMNSKYQEIGVGVVNGQLQGTETTLVVQLFGRPQSAAAQISPEAAQKMVVAPNLQTAPLPKSGEVALVEVRDEKPIENSGQPAVLQNSAVLADTQVATGTLSPAGIISPLDLFKSVFLSLLLLIVLALMYDAYIIEKKNTVRLVGKNFAHFLFFMAIIGVVVFFKSGMVQ